MFEIYLTEGISVENNGYSEIYTSYYWCAIYIGDKEYDVYFK